MADIIKTVEEILTKDKEYVKVGPEIFNQELIRYFQMFTFGDYTKNALMDLNFECQKCGDCCRQRNHKEFCPSLNTDKKCKIYQKENYPLQCEFYPFMLPTIAIINDGIGIKQSNGLKTYFVYELGIIDDLALIVADYDKGWFNSRRKIGDIFEHVKKTAFNSEHRVVIPKWGEENEEYEQLFKEHLEELKKNLK